MVRSAVNRRRDQLLGLPELLLEFIHECAAINLGQGRILLSILVEVAKQVGGQCRNFLQVQFGFLVWQLSQERESPVELRIILLQLLSDLH